MYYELYIDVLFLENFMMDSLLLLAIHTIRKSGTTHRRIFGGSAVGSVLTCIVISLPLPGTVKFLLYHMLVNTVMLKTGIKMKGIKALFKNICLLYLFSFLFGGVLHFFRPYMRTASLFFFVAAGSYCLLVKGWEMLRKMERKQKNICKVIVQTDTGEHEFKALLDTGNTLEDPVTGKSVSIIDKEAARKLCGEEPLKGFHYIPYRCVGKESVMPAFQIDKMCICAEEEKWVSNPVLGIGEERIDKQDEYQMLLNPDILGGI